MKTQEQSSISQVKKPKLEIPTPELVGLKKEKEVTNQTAKLPQPTGWRILILPFKIPNNCKAY